MSDTPEKTPSVDEIRAQISKELDAKYKAQYEIERDKILENKNEILEEKRAEEKARKELEDRLSKFGNITEKDIAELNAVREREANDEIFKLAAARDIEGLSNKLMASQRKAWDESEAEYKDRLKASQAKAEEYEAMVNQLQQENTNMVKRQYLRELVGTDDSFVGMPYFDKFERLYSDSLEIDENGTAYALENGKRVVDSDGNFVPFKKLYEKEKMNDGLFWKGGSGSGMKGGGGGAPLGKKLSDMSFSEKNALRNEIGDEEFSRLVAKQSG